MRKGTRDCTRICSSTKGNHRKKWLAAHEVGQYQNEGITAEMLVEYLRTIDVKEFDRERENIARVLSKLR
ncbi:MAG: hypothetical protein FD169_2482 [Bacillota bacterium]|nr:MAG: hypothetical protein FD169_2482 [Bacillota bacterium]